MPGMKKANTVVSIIFCANMKPPSFQITYDCQPGFQLVGGATKICQADGTWTQVMRRIAMRMTLINDVDVDNNAIEADFDNLDNRQSCRCVFLSNYVVMTTGLHISLDVLPF